MQEKKTERAPGSYEDFVAYLGTVRTEEELFSPLTYWFVGQNCPEDVCFRPQLVEARAKELGFWQGLTFKVERWMTTSRAEAEAAGREAFQSRIGEDYAAYREKAEAARERARRRRLSSPFLYIPKCLDDIPVRDVSWLVEGLLPQGEVFLLGADGGTGKGIWQAQLVAYVTAGKTSGFFPQPPGQTGRVLIFAGEDDPSKVLKARLMAAGADMSRVMVQTQRRLLLPHRQPPVHPGQELRQVHRERRPRPRPHRPAPELSACGGGDGQPQPDAGRPAAPQGPLRAAGLRSPHRHAHQQALQRLGPRPPRRQLGHLGHRPQRPHDGPGQEQRPALPQPREEQLRRPGPHGPAPHRADAGGGRDHGGGRL